MRTRDRREHLPHPAPPGKSTAFGSVAVLTALAAITLLTAACSDHPDTDGTVPETTVDAGLFTVTPQAIPETYVTAGALVANERVDIAARVLGEIRKLAVREGQAVTRGQTLVTIDATEITNRLNEAQARLAEARAQVAEARADFERHQKLLVQKAISARAVEQAQLRSDVAREGLRAAEAAVSQIRAQLEYTEIRSPVTGIVVTRHKQSGDMATPGAPLLTIEDPSNIEVETFVNDRYINRINPGDAVQVSLEAARRRMAGTVTRVVRSGDPGTYRYLVKVVLSDVSDLRAGMFARVEFVTGDKTGIAIPSSALIERSDLPGVYLVDESNIAHLRMVRTGRQWADSTEIVAGLNDGDRIAISNVATLRTGDRITAQPPPSSPDIVTAPPPNSHE